MTTDTVLTSSDKDNFVSDLMDYGTDFVAPLYAVVESIEQAVLQSPEVQAWRAMSDEYNELIRHIHSGGDTLEFLSSRAAMEKKP